MSSSAVLSGGAIPKYSTKNPTTPSSIPRPPPPPTTTMTTKDKMETDIVPSGHLDEFARLLIQDDARLLVDLLKLAVTGKCNEQLK